MLYLTTVYASLKLLGIWPPNQEDDRYRVRATVMISILFYHAIGIGQYLIVCVRDPDRTLADKSEALFTLSGFYNLTYNYMALFSNRRNIAKLFQQLEDFDGFGLPDNLQGVADTLNIVIFVLVVYCGMAGVSVNILSLADYERCVLANEVANGSTLCGFGTQTAYPYDIATGPLLYFHMVLTIFALVLAPASGVTLVTCGLAIFEFIVIRIEHLKTMLGNVFLVEDEEERRRRFRECVIYHIHIIELADKTNNCFRVVTWPSLINYGISIGSTLLAFLIVIDNDMLPKRPSLLAFVHLCGWVAAIFFMCFTGQRILDKSVSIAEAAYDMKWYLGSPELQRDVFFMIMRAESPVNYHSGVLGDFHFITFTNIMSAAYKISTLSTGVGN